IYCSLDLVGGGGQDEKEITSYVNRYPEIFTYHGKIYDKDKLMKIMRSCDIFAMPSRNETFGLVYVESMLQGLPILYTAGEGIDGYYTETIGEKVSKVAEAEEIATGLKKMIKDLGTYHIPTNKLLENHDWSSIAKKYLKIYNLRKY
ncbi:MAG TPA: glycosyltransferase family 4 protein, partial [Chitinophagaceae bacterium]|nr:glycosyltransferase family 4 protein [Chitinophagaceae bacterium]